MSQAAKDTADYHQGAAREGCSGEQGEPAAEEDNEAGKDGDTTAKLKSPQSPHLARCAEQVWCQVGVQSTIQACRREAPAPPQHSLARTRDN